MFIRSLTLRNILSFRDPPLLPLEPLNIFIGANGSGKSNLIDCIGLLRALPGSANNYINDRGGADNWIWRGKRSVGTPTIQANLVRGTGDPELRPGIHGRGASVRNPVRTVVDGSIAIPNSSWREAGHFGERRGKQTRIKRSRCSAGGVGAFRLPKSSGSDDHKRGAFACGNWNLPRFPYWHTRRR